MKHIDKMRKEGVPLFKNPQMRLWVLLIALVSSGFVSAQNGTPDPGWIGGYPKFTLADGSQSLTKGISNVDDYLEIYFNPTEDIVDPTIIISLPSQIAYNANGGYKKGPENESSVEIDKITGSSNLIISFKEALLENEAVHLLISMKADCSASLEDDPEVSVQIKAGNENVGINSKASIGIKEPTISGSFRIPDDVDIEQDILTGIHYDIKSTGGKTSGFTLTFKTKEVVILSDFMIGTKKIEGKNLSFIGPDAEGNVVYTLELNEDLMGGCLDGTGKTIDMNVTLLRCGINEILHDITSTCGKTFNFPNYPIVIKGSSEKPNIVHVSSLHLKTHDPNNVTNNIAHPTANNGLYPSMEALSWIRSIFKNDSETRAYSIAVQFDRYSSYSYLDMENAYYVIREAGGSNPIKGVLQNVKKTASVGTGGTDIGLIKVEYRDKPAGFSAAIQKEHFIPAGGTIEFFIPTYNGNIYDNTIKSDLFYDYPNTTIGGFTANIKKATNACGDAGTFDNNTVRLVWMGVPHFREIPTGINFDGTIPDEKTVRLRISTGNIPQGITSAEMVVYKPEWLTITDVKVMGIDNNEVSGMSAIVGSNGTNQTITLSRSDGIQEGNCFVELKYTSTPTGGSESETIRYEMDFVSDITGTRMKNVYRVSQPVSMTKGEEVALTSFKLQRTTLGLDPDTNGEADPQKIRSDIYMAGDEGQLIWEATLLNDGYKHLYLTLDASNTELADNVCIDGTLTVKIERGSSILDNATAIFTDGYIHCDYEFKAGDIVTLTTDFTTSSSFNKKHFFISKCYVSKDALEKPLEESADRKGNDIRYAECGVYSLDLLYSFGGTSAYYFPFSDNGEHTLYYGYYRSFYSQKLYNPYFSNEIRNLSWPKQIILTAPEGYTIKKIIVQKSGTWSSNMAHEQVEVGISNRSGNEYTFNLEPLYGAGGWEKPNAFWSQSFAIVATADKSAPKGVLTSKVILGTYQNDKPVSLNVAWGSPTLEYKGLNINLTLPTEVSALSKHVTIKNIQIKNPNKQSLADAWLYVKGDVENLSIGSTLGKNNWIQVTNQAIPANDIISCDLEFDYTKSTGGNVEIYVLSGFSSPLDPSGKSIDDLKDNVGEKRTIPIRMGEVVLSGELSVDDSELKYNTDYVLTARITSEASNASILNPKMEITIPENQEIQTAELEYGSTTVDYTKLAARLIGLNTTKFTFDLAKALDQASVTLPGIWDTENKLPREAKLKITYRPMCNTSSSGIRFTGVVKADTPFEGGIVNNRNIRSAYMFPYDNLTYKFQVAIETTEGNYAFNELTNQAEIKIKLNLSRKAEVKEADKLKLVIPEYLAITGDIQWSSEKGFMLDPFKASDLTPDDSDPTLYTLSLPANAFNADKDDVITYLIPVTYTKPSDDEGLNTLAGNPVVALEVNVATQGEAFGGIACGNEPTEASAGMGSRDFAFVLTDKNFPLHAFIGSSSDINVTSGLFNGSWQVGSENFNTPGCSFTPGTTYTDATPGIETGVIEEATINVKISDKEYGSVKAQFKVFPSLDFTLKGDYFTECSALEDISLADYVDNIISQYTIVKFYSDENCEPVDEVTGNVTINTNMDYWAKAENKGGDGNKPGTVISFVINTPVTVTTPEDISNSTLIYEHNATVSLSVTASGTVSENGSLSYQWYKDGTALAGKTSATLEITSANQTHSGNYYVWVNGGICGNVKSEEVSVTVYPNLAINLYQSSLTVCSNEIDVDFYGNIKEYVDNVTYWYSTESDGTGLFKLTANSPILVSSLTTGSYWIYSKHATATTTTPVEFTLKIEKATRIITQPNNISIPRGGNLVLSVIAEGEGTLSYQWQKKVGNDFVDITTGENPTATQATFTLSPAEYTNAGNYRVKVKAAGTVCDGEVISAEANVNVYTPSQEIVYLVTCEASIGGELSVTYQGWPVLSGNYVNNGSRLEVNAQARMAGLYLKSLTVNGAEIENGQSITISSDTHIVAVFEVEGGDPNPDDPTGNTNVVNPVDMWTEKGQLYIRSDRAGRVRIIDFSGRIYTDRVMIEGETVILLPDGFYIVQLNDGTTKKIVISNK